MERNIDVTNKTIESIKHNTKHLNYHLMMKSLQTIHPIVFILICTILEATGDAVVRKSIYNYAGLARFGFLILGMILLFGYGIFLNLAPAEFGRIVGLYIATLFVVWQIINYIAFKTAPTLPVIVGSCLIVTGGLIVTLWRKNP